MNTTSTGKYVGQPYVSPSPDVEVLGQVLFAYTENIRAEEMALILQKYNLTNIQPDQWYPLQLSLDAARALADSASTGTESLVAIGMKLIDTMPFPPDVKTIPQAVEMLNRVVSSIIRNVPDGFGTTIKIINERHLQLVQNDTTPPELAFGYFWAIASRFKPPYNIFLVRHVPNPNPDEEPGDVFDIKWGPLPQDVE
jgi:hypothetical protein